MVRGNREHVVEYESCSHGSLCCQSRLEKELQDVIKDVQQKAKSRRQSPEWSLPPLE